MSTDLLVKIVEKPPNNIKIKLDDFSDENWGEHSTDGNLEEDFFVNPDFAVCGYANGNLVGLLFVFLRNIKIADKIYLLGGVGGVVVDKNMRRKGIATKILEKTIEEMQHRRVDIAMLCTDVKKLGGLYGKVGFKELGKIYFFVNKSGETKKESGGMIRDVGRNVDMVKILDPNIQINVGIGNF